MYSRCVTKAGIFETPKKGNNAGFNENGRDNWCSFRFVAKTDIFDVPSEINDAEPRQ